MACAKDDDGILGTSVKWADFERSLRSTLGTAARLGPNKAAQDIGDGNGLASCCALISCDWFGAAAAEQLPDAIVLKMSTILPLRKFNESLPQGEKMFDYDEKRWAAFEIQAKIFHNTEIAAYDALAAFDNLKIPLKYYGKRIPIKGDDCGQICLQYMENTPTMKFHEKHTVDQVRQIARDLGKIQAHSLKKEKHAPELKKDIFKKLAEVWPLETYRGMFHGVSQVDNSTQTRLLMEKIDELVQKYHGSNLPISITQLMGLLPVLVNGDMHAGNVLIDKDTGALAALIDWQCAHLGVGVEDLHRVAMSSLTTEMRRSSMTMLIEEMYDSLVNNLDGVEPPYTLEQLLLISDLIFPHCALFFASQFISFISRLEKDKNLNREEKIARKEIMLDKILGSLEDVVEIDKKVDTIMGKLSLRSGSSLTNKL